MTEKRITPSPLTTAIDPPAYPDPAEPTQHDWRPKRLPPVPPMPTLTGDTDAAKK